MFRTDEIIKASKLPPEGVAMSRHIDYIYFIPILFVTIVGTFHMHFDLLAGDWDFWLDWKDRQWWPIVTPITAITFCAALQYYNWVNYRQPFGATITILALLAGKWVTIVAAWWWWSNYPYNFVMPSTLLPSAIVLDIVLLLTRNWTLTAVIGAWMFAALFYPTNWAIFAYSHTPLVVDGTLLSWADYMGFAYVRTGTPEYIRMIEVGSLRTFGGHSTMISSFFAAFASSLMYILWWQFGKFFCTSYFYLTDDRQRTTKVHDVFAYATLAHGDKAKIGGESMNAKHVFKRWVMGLCGVATLAFTPALDITPAYAHGERSQEPFLRMRTVNWYDTQWVGKSTPVNGVTELRGKFHLSEDWPRAVVKPNRTFLNVGSPSSVFVRLSSKINGTPMFVAGPMEIGRDYEYVVVLKARLPGHHHIHPMFAVKDAGPIAGPGGWMDITGRSEDFTNPIKTLTGETFDSETMGTATGIMWHLFWGAVAIFWVGFFMVRPMYLVRARVLAAYGEELLLDPIDRKVGTVVLIFVLVVVTVGYLAADARHPVSVPLQAGEAKIKPLPIKPNPLVVEVTHAEYDVPGRALRMNLHATNNGTQPVTIGEFTTAGIRFTNKFGAAKLDPNYPAELVAQAGLTMDNEAAIQPGQTVDVKVESKDVLWEVQRLVDILHDPDQRFAGLLMSWTDSGDRLINPIWAPVLPVFTRLGT